MNNKIKRSIKFELFNPKFDYKDNFSHIDQFSAWLGHQFFVYDLIRNIKPHLIVELGTHNGASFFSMCQAVKDGGINSHLFAIDNWGGDKQAGFYENKVFTEVKKIINTTYPSVKTDLIKKYFDDAILEFKNNSIDLLHIDGLHTYEAVKHDFENWLPKVNSNGIILFHDIFEKKDDFGVYKLWDELKTKYKYFEFTNYHGLGLIFKGEKKFDFETIYQNYYNNLYELNKNRIENKNLTDQKEKLVQDLNKIQSSKNYKLWQKYNKIKKIFKL